MRYLSQHILNRSDDLSLTSLRSSRRLFLLQLFLLSACGTKATSGRRERIVVGVVSYDQGQQIITRYTKFNDYLGRETQSLIEFEPAFNENKALERIQSGSWSLVFAPPGLAATAIVQHQYLPLFPLIGVSNLRSVLVVRQDSPIQNLKELAGKTVALGQPGSATGYYWPIYNLYGLTLGEILFAPTPKAVLELLDQGKAVAGALSLEEFNAYRSQFSQNKFRVLHTDPHRVPAGAVLIGPTVERNRQEQIRKVMSEVPSVLSQEAGYVPNGDVPDYQYMISVVQQVAPITANVRKKPANLF
ncbi:PhnD/SsuA/transferrin family substrate-binding protein [Leptolyngbya sp. FACHB-261]|nr:PhnD/SsuA/transferrin family substrate-binding protein [Leptolyngbya sp. FACHB-261]